MLGYEMPVNKAAGIMGGSPKRRWPIINYWIKNAVPQDDQTHVHNIGIDETSRTQSQWDSRRDQQQDPVSETGARAAIALLKISSPRPVSLLTNSNATRHTSQQRPSKIAKNAIAAHAKRQE